jgi:hypothetical protein
MAELNWEELTQRIIKMADDQLELNEVAGCTLREKHKYMHLVVRAYQYAEQFLPDTDLTWEELKKAVNYDA